MGSEMCIRDRDQIGDHGGAHDVFAEGDGETVGRFPEGGMVENVPQADRIPFLVGDLDADRPSARDGGDNPDARGAQRQRQVIGEIRDLVDLDARGGFELIHSDHRAGFYLHYLPVDAEVGELFLEDAGVGDQGFPFDPRILPCLLYTSDAADE